MHLAFGQIDARAGRDGSVGLAGPHAAFAFQNEEHLFVTVKVIRRAAGRDRADELRDLSAAGFIVNQYPIPTIGSRLRGTIGEPNEWWRHAWIRVWRRLGLD